MYAHFLFVCLFNTYAGESLNKEQAYRSMGRKYASFIVLLDDVLSVDDEQYGQHKIV